MSHDVHCAATFCRAFYWTDVGLWAEDLPPRSLVVLAGADELLHADEVRPGWTCPWAPAHCCSSLGGWYGLQLLWEARECDRHPSARPAFTA